MGWDYEHSSLSWWRIVSSNTVLKPPQILPPTGEQAFKYLSLWGTCLLKLLHSTCWATWYQQPSLTLVPEELSVCMCLCVCVCMCVCDVLMRVSVPPLWYCLIPLKYGLSLDLIQSSCFSARLAFSRPFLSLGSSVLELQACTGYSQRSVELESEVWFLDLCIVYSNHGAIPPRKSLWLENALYFGLLYQVFMSPGI